MACFICLGKMIFSIVHIVGILIGEKISPKIGQGVKLKKCGLIDGQFNFTMALI